MWPMNFPQRLQTDEHVFHCIVNNLSVPNSTSPGSSIRVTASIDPSSLKLKFIDRRHGNRMCSISLMILGSWFLPKYPEKYR